MDIFLLKLAVVTYLFGPAVAIPFAGDKMDIITVGSFVLILQGITVLLLFEVLEFVDYKRVCKRRLLRKVCELTHHEVDEIGKNANTIVEKFHRRGGHHGYYLSLFVLSFALGFSWAVIISYSLGLRRMYSYPAIMLGSAFSFGFWYTVLILSLNFVTAEVFTLFSICLGLSLLFYGRLHERKELVRIASFIKSAPGKTKVIVKKRFRRVRSHKSPNLKGNA